MPIYEYQCRKCGRVTEAIQKHTDRPLRKCRSCSGRLDKMISRTSFMLKGGGWYTEGYNKGKKSETKSGGKTDSSDSSSDSGPPKKTASATA